MEEKLKTKVTSMNDEPVESSFNKDWKEIKRVNLIESESILVEIQKIISSVNELNLLSMLTRLAFYIKEGEDIYERSAVYNLREMPIIHLVSGLVLQGESKNDKPNIKANDLYTLIKLSSSYLIKISPFLGLVEDDYDEKKQLLHSHLQSMKMIRPINPDRYPYQTEKYVEFLDNRISELFVKKSGLSPNLFLNIGKAISEYILEKINFHNKDASWFSKIQQFVSNPQSDEYFLDTVNNKSQEDEGEYFDFYFRYLLASSSNDLLWFTIDELKKSDIFISIDEAYVEKYLHAYSCKVGDQPIGSELLIDNVLFYKPFINWDDVYFCPAPSDIISSLPYCFEKLFESEKLAVPPTRIWDRYQKSKAYFVEDKAEEFFLRIFPKSSVFKNIIYEFNGNIEEADILIPFDNKLIVVQAKSGSFNSAARRGAEKAFKNTLKKIYEESYQQCVKVRSFVDNGKNVIFKYRDSKEVAFSSNPESNQTTEYIFISLTLEPLGVLSARIKNLKAFGFFQNNEYPLAMSIYDLDTITSILPSSPSVFLHYIKERIRSQMEEVFFFQDELTPFGWYLEQGSLKKPNTIGEDVTHIGVDPDYLIKFDEYYLRGGVKPTLLVEEEWLNLIKHIEDDRNPGFSVINEHLLNIMPETRERLIKRINEAFNKKYKKEVIGITSLTNSFEVVGVTFVTYDVPTAKLNYILETYSLLRKYQAKKQFWIGLAKQQKSNGPWWKVTCLQYFDFPWTFDERYDSIPNTFTPSS
ncbi:hypothetical protein ACO2Q8_16575 [Larkinella sp. VNQ87]|uniref:hypothetical protein n=1 Tax=Larkinella sp. VNQ87 TaxID=3400921 RepID=UPI003C10930F